MHFLRFNNFRLDINGYKVDELDTSQMPDIRLNKYELAHDDGSVITGKYFGEKKIVAKGRVNGSDVIDMNDKLDALKYQFSLINRPLDYEINGETRRCTATVASLSIDVSGYACFYTVTFSCNSYAELIDSTTLTFNSPTTSGPSYHALSIDSNYNPHLSVDLTVNSYNGVATNDSITIENVTNGERMRVTREWRWADKLSVDGENRQVWVYPATLLSFDTFDTSVRTTTVTASTTDSVVDSLFFEGSGMLEVLHTGSSTSLEFYTIGDFDGSTLNLDNSDYLIFVLYGPSALSNTTNIQVRFGNSPTTTNYKYANLTTQYDGAALTDRGFAVMKVDLNSLSTAGTGASLLTVSEIRFVFTGSGSYGNKPIYIDGLYASEVGATPELVDYEGSFVTLNPGSNQIKISDNFITRNYTITGSYKKRFI